MNMNRQQTVPANHFLQGPRQVPDHWWTGTCVQAIPSKGGWMGGREVRER